VGTQEGPVTVLEIRRIGLRLQFFLQLLGGNPMSESRHVHIRAVFEPALLLAFE
jgi:hypothetical protein